MSEKSTNAEIVGRVTKVFDLLVLGSSRAQILQYVAEKTTWGVNERQVGYYIEKANKKLEAAAEYHQKRELGKALTRLNILFMSCMKVQDYQRALAVQREINAMLGLNAPTKIEAEIFDWRAAAIQQGRDPDKLLEEFKSYMLHAAESTRTE